MIGVGFLGATSVFALQHTDADTIVIESLGESVFPVIETPDAIQSTEFKQAIENLFSTIRSHVQKPDQIIGVAVPSEWLHLYTSPVEPNLQTAELDEFARWSFQKRMGSHAEQFEPRFYTLSAEENQKTILTVAFPNELLNIFNTAANDAELTLSYISIDVFAGWGAIPFSEKPQYLCKFTPNNVVISQSYQDELIGTGLYQWNQPDEFSFLRGTIRKEIAEEWRELLGQMVSETSLETSLPVWVYGNAIPENLQELIETQDHWAYVNPFAHFDLRLAEGAPADSRVESRYAEVGGLIRQMIQDFT